MFRKLIPFLIGSLLFAGRAGANVFGPNIHSQNTLQSGTTIYVTSATITNLNTSTVKYPDGTSQTTALVAGSGDAVRAATQTWSGANTYSNGTTSPAIKILQQGNVGTTPGTGGAFVIDTTSNTGNGMQIYTNRLNGTQLTGLLSLYSNTTSYDEPMLYIFTNSSATVGANTDIRIDSPNPDIVWKETTQVAPAGKFQIAVKADTLQFNSRRPDDAAFRLHLGMSHPGALQFYSQDDNRNYVSLIASASLSGTTNWVLPPADGLAGQVWGTDGAGNLKFVTPAGSGDALLAANQSWTGVNTHNTSGANGAIKINQSGTTTDSPTVGALAINNTGNNGIGLAVYSNQGGTQVDPLINVNVANTNFGTYIMELNVAATNYYATTIEMQAPIPSIEFRGNVAPTAPINEFQISEKGDELRIDGRQADNNGFGSVMVMSRPTSGTPGGGLVYIGNNYVDPINSLDVGGDTSGSSVGVSSGNAVIGRSYAGTVKAPPDSLLVQGFVGLGSLTLAQINATTPVRAGQEIYCSDCAVYAVCVSSGTGTGAFVVTTARNTHCN
jgi:hypothetical protein